MLNGGRIAKDSGEGLGKSFMKEGSYAEERVKNKTKCKKTEISNDLYASVHQSFISSINPE